MSFKLKSYQIISCDSYIRESSKPAPEEMPLLAPIFHVWRPNLVAIFNGHIIYLIWTKVLGGYMPGRFSGKKCRSFFWLLYIYIYIYICIIFLSFYMMSHFNPALCLPFSVKKRKKLFFELNIKLSKSPLKDWHVLKVALELGQKSLFGVKLQEK